MLRAGVSSSWYASSTALTPVLRFEPRVRVVVRTKTYPSSTKPYPFPTRLNPTPQEIFHLPRNASQEEIKSRYYELMKLYHPDSPSWTACASVPIDIRRRQYDAIRKAYDALQVIGKLHGDIGSAEIERHLDLEKWKAAQYRRADLHVSGIDDQWKDRFLFGALVLALCGLVLQMWDTRRQALNNARRQPRADAARRDVIKADLGALSTKADEEDMTLVDKCQ